MTRATRINFGAIDTILLLGGGSVLCRLLPYIKARGLRTAVFSSDRHLTARLDGSSMTLEGFLGAQRVGFVSCTDISNEPRLEEFQGTGTLAISLGAPWIFNEEFIERFSPRLLNVHGAPLPRHRGAGGYSWRIMMDDYAGCSLVHVIDRGLDTGPIVKQQAYEFPRSCRIPIDFERFQHDRDVAFLRDFLDEVAAGRTFELVPQSHEQSSYFPRLFTNKHGAVDWSWSAPQLDRFIRAFDEPYAGAFTNLRDQRVALKDCHLCSDEGPFHAFQAGLIYRVHDGTAYIAAAAEGAIGLTRILAESGENLIPALRPGLRLYTSGAALEEARLFRAIYSPVGIKLGS